MPLPMDLCQHGHHLNSSFAICSGYSGYSGYGATTDSSAAGYAQPQQSYGQPPPAQVSCIFFESPTYQLLQIKGSIYAT